MAVIAKDDRRFFEHAVTFDIDLVEAVDQDVRDVGV